MVVRVSVRKVNVLIIKPKLHEVVKQYAISAFDDSGHAETVFVDAPKYNKDKVTEEFKKRFASWHGVPPSEIEVVWYVEPPAPDKL